MTFTIPTLLHICNSPDSWMIRIFVTIVSAEIHLPALLNQNNFSINFAWAENSYQANPLWNQRNYNTYINHCIMIACNESIEKFSHHTWSPCWFFSCSSPLTVSNIWFMISVTWSIPSPRMAVWMNCKSAQITILMDKQCTAHIPRCLQVQKIGSGLAWIIDHSSFQTGKHWYWWIS